MTKQARTRAAERHEMHNALREMHESLTNVMALYERAVGPVLDQAAITNAQQAITTLTQTLRDLDTPATARAEHRWG